MDHFLPYRWNDRSQIKNLVVFGKGPRSCPAQSAALTCLSGFADYIRSNGDICFWKFPWSNSRVGTIHVPPQGIFRYYN